MELDKNTLQSQLDRLLADAQIITTGIQQRSEVIQKFNLEVEQHRGAQAYIAQSIEIVKKQLEELASIEG